LLKGVHGLTLQKEASWAKSVFWMYSVLVDDKAKMNREILVHNLKNQGIETRNFFYPIHLQPAYLHEFPGQQLPVAEELSRKGINLPSGLNLKKTEIKYVAEKIISSLSIGN